MKDFIFTSHNSRDILSQFKCELSNIQRIEALNSFSKINGANNVISEKLNQTYGVQLEQKEPLIPSNSFIAQEIKKVICEANRNTPSISIHRLKVVLAGCFANSMTEVKELTGKDHCFIMRWLSRFLEDGIEGLKDKQRSGRPLSYDEGKLLINIKELLMFKPRSLAEKINNWPLNILPSIQNHDTWSLYALASVNNISKSTLIRFLSRHGMCLVPNTDKSYCFSYDPEFERKLADVVGLYELPFGKKDDKGREVVVLNFDEKPAIPIHKLKFCVNSKQTIVNGSEYERLGTCNLFAVLEPKTGHVICDFSDTKTRDDVEYFLTTVVSSNMYNNKRIHIVMDNINTHFAFSENWYKNFSDRVTLHYTPTHCSWANLVETFFSIFSRSVLKNASWNSIDEFKNASRRFIAEYNTQCKPYNWSFSNLQVYFNQRRDTIHSIKLVTETPVDIEFGMQNHVISSDNTLCQAKVKLEEFNQKKQGKTPFFKSLYRVSNLSQASCVLEKVLGVLEQIPITDIDVFAPEVKKPLDEVYQNLSIFDYLKIELTITQQELIETDNIYLIKDLKLKLASLEKSFKKVVKRCLFSLKRACGAVFKDIEVYSLVVNLISKLKQSKFLDKLTCEAVHSEGNAAYMWSHKIWEIINCP